MLALAGLMLASCEPALLQGPAAAAPMASTALQSAFVIDGQFADAACTIPQTDGNYIKYSTSPAVTVQVSTTKADGTKNVLATGASGVFNITPRRGADPNQPFTVTTINQDATTVSFESSVNVFVPGDLAPEVKVLTGESGAKAWKWYTVDGACWGNAGFNAGKAASPTDIPGKWWGCTPEQLETEQVAHSGGTVYGYGDPDAYMIFNEDGECISYKADGTQIAKGSHTFEDYDPEGAGAGYGYGKIVTTDAPILFPFDINTQGSRTNEFQVVYVDPNVLALISDKGAGDWGECTWWRFKNASDADAALAGNGQRAWTWYTIDGATWGNAGYNAGTANAAGEIPGKWWGCTPTQLETEQLAHSGGVAYGYGSDDAYMVFDSANGTVTSYKADGSEIKSSGYAVEDFVMDPTAFSKGTISTTDGSGILFPFAINQGGAVTTTYEIVYLDGTIMSLIGNYAQSADWGECTWWRFKPKN
jgi:hypothetical protein